MQLVLGFLFRFSNLCNFAGEPYSRCDFSSPIGELEPLWRYLAIAISFLQSSDTCNAGMGQE